MSAVSLLLGSLVLLGVWFVAQLVAGLRRVRARRPSAAHTGVGAVTNFLDTLGIGSFATTTSLYRLLRLVPDGLIPGTLNVGHTLPTLAQAFIYVAIIDVDPATLFAMIGAAMAGAWLGAERVSRLSERGVRLGMGGLLLCAAGLMLARSLGALPPGGDAHALRGGLLAAGVLGNFVLGALMPLGIGLYAPCMVLVSLLGMDPRSAFPIMMGSCAFLMPIASVRFVRHDRYEPRAAQGLSLGGVPAVLIAAYLVKELPLDAVRVLVVLVVVYTAFTLLRAGIGGRFSITR